MFLIKLSIVASTGRLTSERMAGLPFNTYSPKQSSALLASWVRRKKASFVNWIKNMEVCKSADLRKPSFTSFAFE